MSDTNHAARILAGQLWLTFVGLAERLARKLKTANSSWTADAGRAPRRLMAERGSSLMEERAMDDGCGTYMKYPAVGGDKAPIASSRC